MLYELQTEPPYNSLKWIHFNQDDSLIDLKKGGEFFRLTRRFRILLKFILQINLILPMAFVYLYMIPLCGI